VNLMPRTHRFVRKVNFERRVTEICFLEMRTVLLAQY